MRSPAEPGRRPWAPRLAAAVAGGLLGLLSCEAGLRALAAYQTSRGLEAWRALGDGPAPTGRARLEHLIRPSPERRIIYELVPNLSVEFMGATVAINEDGFRGPRRAREPAPATVRIVGLGDSVLFGWGVAEGESFLDVLERRLQAEHPQVRFEAVNTGVPGYNTVMEVETLRVKGLAYRPDLVILDYVGNDLSLPNFVPRQGSPWTASRSLLLQRVRAALAGRAPPAFAPLVAAPLRDGFQFESDPDRVPEAYRDLVGLEAYQGAMRELAELARQHGFEVVVTTHLAVPDYVRAACEEHGFLLVETLPRLDRFMREEAIAGRQGSVLTVGRTDPHPSALAHRLQAEEVHRALAEEGLLAALLGR